MTAFRQNNRKNKSGAVTKKLLLHLCGENDYSNHNSPPWMTLPAGFT